MEGRLSAFGYDERWQKARLWADKLIQFPFVRKVSLTGSMAMGLATPTSDIDFFIQVAEGNLWWVRLAITSWIQLAGERRTQTAIANKICLNWWATFDGPETQGRPHIVLAVGQDVRSSKYWSRVKNPKFKTLISKKTQITNVQNSKHFEFNNFKFGFNLNLGFRNLDWKTKQNSEWILKPFCPILEFLARNIQQHRFLTDPRTHLKSSQVRFSNSELGFHPPKMH